MVAVLSSSSGREAEPGVRGSSVSPPVSGGCISWPEWPGPVGVAVVFCWSLGGGEVFGIWVAFPAGCAVAAVDMVVIDDVVRPVEMPVDTAVEVVVKMISAVT